MYKALECKYFAEQDLQVVFEDMFRECCEFLNFFYAGIYCKLADMNMNWHNTYNLEKEE